MSYRDNLRQAVFVAPGGSVHTFKFDELSRQGGRKAAVIEILDSDEGYVIDLGALPRRYPMDIYFTGENYDTDADAFFAALSERYKQSNPGYLMHPRWGNIEVIPLTWMQHESFKDKSGVGHFSVEFLTVFSQVYPATDANSEAAALNKIDAMASGGQTIAEGARLTNPSALANIKGKLKSAVGVVSGNLRTIAALAEDVSAVFEEVQSTVNDAIDDISGSIIDVIAGIQYLIRLPAKIATETMEKVNTYRDMIDELINGIDDKNEEVVDNQVNNAQLVETVVGIAVAAMAEAAVYTEYESRNDSVDSIESLRAGYEAFLAGMESAAVTGSADDIYGGDHDYLSDLKDIIAKITGVLLNRTFDLKAEQRFVLTGSSDAITLCWEYYSDVTPETLEFFCRTNGLAGDEFVEIPAGRELVVYV